MPTKKDIKNKREIVNISSIEDNAFPLTVNYEGIIGKLSQKGFPYLMVFRKEGDILTIGNKPVTDFYAENMESLKGTEGVMVLEKIESKRSPSGFTVVVKSLHVTKKFRRPKVQVTFDADYDTPSEVA